MMNYDYYSDKETNEFGLAKTAELIDKHRSQNPNTLLVDNGDLIRKEPLLRIRLQTREKTASLIKQRFTLLSIHLTNLNTMQEHLVIMNLTTDYPSLTVPLRALTSRLSMRTSKA
ncbi:hypothetical protein ACEQPO_05990 [Bacillus sp. SL00103]